MVKRLAKGDNVVPKLHSLSYEVWALQTFQDRLPHLRPGDDHQGVHGRLELAGPLDGVLADLAFGGDSFSNIFLRPTMGRSFLPVADRLLQVVPQPDKVLPLLGRQVAAVQLPGDDPSQDGGPGRTAPVPSGPPAPATITAGRA